MRAVVLARRYLRCFLGIGPGCRARQPDGLPEPQRWLPEVVIMLADQRLASRGKRLQLTARWLWHPVETLARYDEIIAKEIKLPTVSAPARHHWWRAR